MHSDDEPEGNPNPPRTWQVLAFAAVIGAISLIPGTHLPGNGLQWSTEYHEQAR